MNYTAINKIGTALAAEISHLADFRAVEYLAVTNGTQVYKRLQALASTPCALVVMGAIEYDSDNLRRTFRVMIFIMDKYQVSFKRQSDSIWELSERVGEFFVPKQSEDGSWDKTVLEKVEFSLESIVPFEAENAALSCCSVNLEAVDYINSDFPTI